MSTDLTLDVAQSRVLTLPGRPRFMLDADLANFYGTKTENVTRIVRRNSDRFPEDFVFQLSDAELEILRRQNGGANSTKSRHLPLAFTQAGALALSGVLKTPRAAEVSVMVFRAFAAVLDTRAELALLRRFNRHLTTELLTARPLWNRVMRFHEAGYWWSVIQYRVGKSQSEFLAHWEAMQNCGLVPDHVGCRDKQLKMALAEMRAEEA